MATPTCSRCGGKRWVCYFSETTDGNFEEAFRLCPCNHEPEGRGIDRGEELEGARKQPARRCIVMIELRVKLG